MRFQTYVKTRLFFFAIASAAIGFSLASASEGYVYEVRDATGKIVEIEFLGDADWLAAQADRKSHFHLYPGLRSLSLQQHKITQGELSYVSTLKNVRRLTLGKYPDAVDIECGALTQLKSMEWLEELDVHANTSKSKDWSFLSELESLRALRVGPLFDERGLKNVSGLEWLESLDLCGDLSDESASVISELPRLKYLRIVSPRISEEFLKMLEEAAGLRSLIVNGVDRTASCQKTEPSD